MLSHIDRTDLPSRARDIPGLRRASRMRRRTVTVRDARRRSGASREHIEDLCRQARRSRASARSRPACSAARTFPARDAPPEVLAADVPRLRRPALRARPARRRCAPRATDASAATLGALVPWGFCLGGRFAHLLGAVERARCRRRQFLRTPALRAAASQAVPAVEVTGLIEVPYLGHFAEFDD